MAEQLTRNEQVVGSSPTSGFLSGNLTYKYFLQKKQLTMIYFKNQFSLLTASITTAIITKYIFSFPYKEIVVENE